MVKCQKHLGHRCTDVLKHTTPYDGARHSDVFCQRHMAVYLDGWLLNGRRN